jgi:general secretion pathway protein E
MNNSYRVRKAIFEILILDDPLKRMILKTSDSNRICDKAMKREMTNLLSEGGKKVSLDITNN